MKILAIDTSTKYFCLGLYDKGKVYEYTLETGKNLSRVITAHIKRVLDSIGWEAEDIDYFACGIGPGSFTGIRIGVATIKGLSWALNKPIAAVPSLDILAMNANTDKYIVPVVDAKRNLIYCSVYKKKGTRLQRLGPYMLLDEKKLCRKIKKDSALLGDALNLYKPKILSSVKGIQVLDKDYWLPQARNIISLALEKIKENKLKNSFEIKPIYLYPKECQVRNHK